MYQTANEVNLNVFHYIEKVIGFDSFIKPSSRLFTLDAPTETFPRPITDMIYFKEIF